MKVGYVLALSDFISINVTKRQTYHSIMHYNIKENTTKNAKDF